MASSTCLIIPVLEPASPCQDCVPDEYTCKVIISFLLQGFGSNVEEVVDCKQTDGASDTRWRGTFPWSEHLMNCNEDFFGNVGFRPNQLEAINATMEMKDCFVLMPTGGGETCPWSLIDRRPMMLLGIKADLPWSPA